MLFSRLKLKREWKGERKIPVPFFFRTALLFVSLLYSDCLCIGVLEKQKKIYTGSWSTMLFISI